MNINNKIERSLIPVGGAKKALNNLFNTLKDPEIISVRSITIWLI